MTSGKAILCGIDLGPDSETVLSYAAFFAASSDIPVRLLHVIDYLLTPPPSLAAYIEEEKKKDEAEMARWEAALKGTGIAAESCIMVGRLHESFGAALDEGTTAMMVIGYKSHLFRPSSSERLIMSLRVPMLVVRPKSSGRTAIGEVKVKKILCPVDFSENSRKAASVALQYAAAFSAGLDLMHVIPSHHIREKLMLWSRMDAEERGRFDELMNADAASTMSAFCAGEGIGEPGELFHGMPGEVIPAVAGDRDHDLIVIGARGLSYTQGLLVGSTTAQVLRSAPCPVLIVH